MVKKLEKYKKRRDFNKTDEPKPIVKRISAGGIFVVQKHAASHLHYDFRLSIDGVLKSWAVPKGPSSSTNVKRLAIETEDHPMDYANFEGVIPKGEYGAGTVMVWDRGKYFNIAAKDEKTIPLKECVKKGHIEVLLKGKKMKGGYALIRFKGKNWLLIKKRDEEASKSMGGEVSLTRSVKSGKTMSEIKRDAEK